AWSVASTPTSRGATEPGNARNAAAAPPSGNARTSWIPVLAPLGAPARPRAPDSRTSVASTVGWPRLSMIAPRSAETTRLTGSPRTRPAHRRTRWGGRTRPADPAPPVGRLGRPRAPRGGSARRAGRPRSGHGTPDG